MRAFLSCLPALLAALLIAVSPGCASVRHADPEPSETTVENRPPDYIGGIERGAGQVISEQDKAELTVVGFQLGAWLALLAICGLGFLIYTLVELISESLDMPYEEVVEMIQHQPAG